MSHDHFRNHSKMLIRCSRRFFFLKIIDFFLCCNMIKRHQLLNELHFFFMKSLRFKQPCVCVDQCCYPFGLVVREEDQTLLMPQLPVSHSQPVFIQLLLDVQMFFTDLQTCSKHTAQGLRHPAKHKRLCVIVSIRWMPLSLSLSSSAL